MSKNIYKRHKRFNSVYPYTYWIKNKETGIKYHGVRWANIGSNRTPEEDLGIIYFTSGKLKEILNNILIITK